MPTRPALPRKAVYPLPGSRADQVLTYVKANPGTTINQIITGLKANSSTVRKALSVLEEKERVVDAMDDNGHHHYTAKVIF